MSQYIFSGFGQATMMNLTSTQPVRTAYTPPTRHRAAPASTMPLLSVTQQAVLPSDAVAAILKMPPGTIEPTAPPDLSTLMKMMGGGAAPGAVPPQEQAPEQAFAEGCAKAGGTLAGGVCTVGDKRFTMKDGRIVPLAPVAGKMSPVLLGGAALAALMLLR
jgi:hypothetical protein